MVSTGRFFAWYSVERRSGVRSGVGVGGSGGGFKPVAAHCFQSRVNNCDAAGSKYLDSFVYTSITSIEVFPSKKNTKKKHEERIFF